MTFLSTEVQHPSKECETLFCISLKKKNTLKRGTWQQKWLIFSLNLFHEKATLERELPRGGNIHEWSYMC